MKKFFFCFFSVLICYLLQTTVFSFFEIGHIRPNLMVMITCIIGFNMGSSAGIISGFFSGLLVDAMTGGSIGLSSLIYMMAGYLNGLFTKDFDKQQLLLPLSLVTMSAVVYEVIYYVFYFLLQNKLAFGYYFRRIIIPEVLYTLILTLVSYLIIYRVIKGLGRQHRKKVIESA